MIVDSTCQAAYISFGLGRPLYLLSDTSPGQVIIEVTCAFWMSVEATPVKVRSQDVHLFIFSWYDEKVERSRRRCFSFRLSSLVSFLSSCIYIKVYCSYLTQSPLAAEYTLRIVPSDQRSFFGRGIYEQRGNGD